MSRPRFEPANSRMQVTSITSLAKLLCVTEIWGFNSAGWGFNSSEMWHCHRFRVFWDVTLCRKFRVFWDVTLCRKFRVFRDVTLFNRFRVFWGVTLCLTFRVFWRVTLCRRLRVFWYVTLCRRTRVFWHVTLCRRFRFFWDVTQWVVPSISKERSTFIFRDQAVQEEYLLYCSALYKTVICNLSDTIFIRIQRQSCNFRFLVYMLEIHVQAAITWILYYLNMFKNYITLINLTFSNPQITEYYKNNDILGMWWRVVWQRYRRLDDNSVAFLGYRMGQQDHLKCWYTFIKLYGVTYK
jgi:hypothetical protein